MRNDTRTRQNWPLFWNGLVALTLMAILVAAQVTPQPRAQGVPFATGASILILTLLGIGDLAVFMWAALSEDVDSVPDHAATLRQEKTGARQAVVHATRTGV